MAFKSKNAFQCMIKREIKQLTARFKREVDCDKKKVIGKEVRDRETILDELEKYE